MKKILISIIIFLFLALPLQAFEASGEGWEGNDYYTHTGTTADDITFAWDYTTLGTDEDFEIEIHNPERNITRHVGYTTANEITFKVPKTGHWTAKVRTRRLLSDDTYSYGEWAESTNPDVAVVNIDVCDEDGCTLTPINKAWWTFAWIKSTGPIITNSSGGFFGLDRN